ncbi:MAG TPA: hypothetical protein VFS32_07465 [Candidatus Limnocylindrales bacterium]|nr:hypothetical protein [Candidatus Limnocylindrales bacterium]
MSPLRLAPLLLAVVALLLPSTTPSATAGDYTTFRSDFSAEELVRLINGERHVHGLRRLKTDRVLATKSRNGAVACPNDEAKVAYGRAHDLAVSGVFDHGLRLCGVRSDGTYRYTVIDAMYDWGYNTYRGEIIAWNTYGLSRVSYHYGCSLSGTRCSATRKTTTTASVAAAMSAWMRSSGHRPLILGGYNRVGCGAWETDGGVRYYSCLFSLGGPGGRDLTRPTVSSVTGRDSRVSGTVTFSATFGDDFRLADGWARLDGKRISQVAFDLNVRSHRSSVTIDTTRLANGWHTLVWRTRDVATHRSVRRSGKVLFLVRN